MSSSQRKFVDRARLVVDELRHALRPAEVDFSTSVSATVQACRLEERVLMSASPIAALVQPVADAAMMDASAAAPDGPTAINDTESISDSSTPDIAAADLASSSTGSQGSSSGSSTAVVEPGIELIVIDSRVEDADDLLSQLLNSDRDVRLLRLDADTDGIQQITSKLEKTGPVSAIHLLTHGRSGEIQLGSTTLNQQTLSQHAAELLAWQHTLTNNADLLLYGCDVADGANGQDFIAALSQLTGADVASSDDRTGAEELGGDWDFESQLGAIESTETTSLLASANWQHTLDLMPTAEFQVNTTTTSDQTTDAEARGSQNAVAIDAAGNSIVVWTSKNQDGGANGVYARLFNADGTARTAEIQVNTNASQDQQWARVACDSAGNFVVTWTSIGQDGSGYGVYLRRFSSTGTALSGEVRVNTTTAGDQKNSVVAMNASGEFIVAWQNTGGTVKGILARRFAASGTAVNVTEVQITDEANGVPTGAAVAMSSDGTAVIAWESSNHVYFRRITAAGATNGSRTQIDSGLFTASGVSAAMDGNGNSTFAYCVDTTSTGIWIHGFKADGSHRYGWTQVVSGDAKSGSIAMTGTGEFIVTYDKPGDGDGTGIYARKYSATGSANGSEFLVNENTGGNQASASAAIVNSTDFTIVWSGEGDGDTSGVHARQFANLRPTISSIADVEIDEDQSEGPLNFIVDDPDGDEATLTISVASSNTALIGSSGLVLGGSGANRTLTLTPLPDQSGTSTITLTVGDGTKTATSTFLLTVNAVNDPPVLGPTTVASMPEGGWLTIDGTMLSATDADHTATQITYTLGTVPANGTLRRSTTILTAGMTWTQDDLDNNRISYEHNGSETTSDSFSFTVRDTAGAMIGPATFSVSVSPLNDAPVLTPTAPVLTTIEVASSSTPLLISSLLGSSVSDADAGAVEGIAVFAFTGGGTWQYSSEGITWTSIASVSNSQALLLPDTDQLRYVAGSTSETATISFRAWDQTGATIGLAHTKFDTTTGVGSIRSFSVATDTALLTVENLTPAGTSDSFSLVEDASLTVTTSSNWFNNNWKWRQSITIDNATGTVNLTNQPVLVKFDATTIDYSRTQNAGQDLRFFDQNGTLLAHEIECWDESGTSHVWVRVPTIAAGSTSTIKVYYGNSTATDAQNSAGVWGSDAETVLHLDGATRDVSANAVTATVSGAVAATGASAEGLQFDGVDDFLQMNDSPVLNDIFVGGGTISAWINPNGWGENGFGRIMDKASTTLGGTGWALQVTSSGRILFEHGFTLTTGDWRTDAGSIALNQWQHVAVVYDSSLLTNTPQLFIDGVAVNVTTNNTPVGIAGSDSGQQLTIGNRALATDRTFDGQIDEVRVYSNSRTAAQINADYRTAATQMTTPAAIASPLGGVLNNDAAPTGANMSVSVANGPAHAQSFTLNADGSFNYTPDTNYSGSDSFTYTISDGTRTSSPVTVNLNITGLNDAPTAINLSANSITGYTNAAVVGTVTVTDPDVGDTHTLTVSDARFQIVSGQLQLRSGQQIDPIAETSIALTITAADAAGLTTSRNVTLTVINPNQAPSVSLSSTVSSLPENTSTTSRIRIANITVTDDTYGTNTLSLSGTDAAFFEISSSRLYLKAGTVLNFEAKSSYSVRVLVDDSTIGATPDAQRSVTLSITNVNEAPIANAGGPYTIAEGQNLTVSASSSSDPDGDTLTYDWDIDGDNVFGNGSGVTRTFSWSDLQAMGPAINDNSTRTISLRVTDSAGLSSITTASLIVTNTPPTVAITGPATTLSGVAYPLALSSTDPGNDTITSWTINWGDGTIENITGNPSTASHTFATPGLTHVISATVTDEDGTHPLTSPTVTVTVANTAPSNLTIAADRLAGSTLGAVVGPLTFTDPDNGDVHVWTVSDARFEVVGGILKLKDTELIDAVIEPNVTLSVAVTDLSGESTAVSVSLRINRPPVATANTYEVNNPGTFVVSSRSSGVLANDSDPDGDSISPQLVTGPANAASFTLNSNGTFSYNPSTGFAGTDSFQYRAYDGLSLSSPVTVTLNVNRKATLGFARFVAEVDETLSLPAPVLIGTLNIIDDSVGTNSLALTGTHSSMFELDGSQQLWLKAGSTFDYEVLQQLSVTVTVNDPTIAGTPDNTRTITVNVRNVNETPVATTLPSQTLIEDAAAGTFNTAFAFSDPDGDALSWSVSILNQSTTLFSSLTINSQTGVLSHSLAPDAFGSALIRVVATDAGGMSAAATMSIMVQPVNDAPSVQAFAATTTGTTLLATPLPGVLTGARDAENSPLTAVLIVGPANGTLTFNANGTFTYRAASGFFGTDSFQFAASDGTLTSTAAAASINVRPLAVNPGATPADSTDSGSSSTTTPVTTAIVDSGSTGTGGTGSSGNSTGTGGQQTGTTSGGIAAISPVGSANLASTGNGSQVDEDDSIGSSFIPGRIDAGMDQDSSRTVATLTGLMTNAGNSATSANRRGNELRIGTVDPLSELAPDDSTAARSLRVALERDLFYRHLVESRLSEDESLEDQIEHPTHFDARVVGSVGVVTTGFSVGYLLWIVRGGMLLSGILAQMPAWTMVDPLLVVDDKQKDDDKESLQTLMDKQQAELNARKDKQRSPEDAEQTTG